MSKYLIDTNVLIYHTSGIEESIDFITGAILEESFNISVITKIEFLGWNRHTVDGFEECRKLIEQANIYFIDEDISNKAIELKRFKNIKLGDAIIAATAIIHNLELATRNTDDFKMIETLELVNPFVRKPK